MFPRQQQQQQEQQQSFFKDLWAELAVKNEFGLMFDLVQSNSIRFYLVQFSSSRFNPVQSVLKWLIFVQSG